MIYYVTVMAKLHQYFFLDSNKLIIPFGNPFTLYGLPPSLFISYMKFLWSPLHIHVQTRELFIILCGLQISIRSEYYMGLRKLGDWHMHILKLHGFNFVCSNTSLFVTCNQKLTLKGNIILASISVYQHRGCMSLLLAQAFSPHAFPKELFYPQVHHEFLFDQ